MLSWSLAVRVRPAKALCGHGEDTTPATIQGVSGGMLNILGGGSMDCPE